MVSAVEQINKQLAGTPYLLPESGEGDKAARAVAKNLQNIRRKVRRLHDSFAEHHEALHKQVQADMAYQQVFESNALEGLGLDMRGTHELLSTRKDRTVEDILRDRAVRESILNELARRSSRAPQTASVPRIRDTLSLDDAYRFAEELARTRPLRIAEADLRSLHSLIVPQERFAGNYKQKEVQIVGSGHQPTPVIDVPAQVRSLLDWCNASRASALLKACVAHAWLTHIHPFEDGNGRAARVLANMMLSTEAYPPLIIRSAADKGEYLSALAASDTAGNILYFLTLFSKAINRAVVHLEHPAVARRLLLEDLYGPEDTEYLAWDDILAAFSEQWCTAMKGAGFDLEDAGHIRASDFSLLQDYNPVGNGWFLKVRRSVTRFSILIWFGFNSLEYRDVMGADRPLPSIFFAERDRAPLARHPYKPLVNSGRFTVDELVLIPGDVRPVAIRRGLEVQQVDVAEAVEELMNAMAHHERLLMQG